MKLHDMYIHVGQLDDGCFWCEVVCILSPHITYHVTSHVSVRTNFTKDDLKWACSSEKHLEGLDRSLQ